MTLRSLVVSLVAAAVPAAAQPGQLSGPLAGYVYDQTVSALRPVRGVPGAATLGDPLALGITPVAGFVAPRQDLAVMVSSDGVTHWYNLSGSGASEVSASGPIATPGQVVFSPSGTAAALIAGRSVQVVTGLPASPAPAGRVILEAGTLPLVLPRAPVGEATWLAVSDDGAWLLVASAGQLRLLAVASGNSLALMPASRGAAVAFAPGSHDAALASGDSLTWIHDAAGGASQQTVARNSAFATPVGVAFSADSATLFAANRAGLVWSYRLADGVGSQQASGIQPTTLDRMGDYFRLNQPGAGPLWLLDPAAAPPRLFFVPAATSN